MIVSPTASSAASAARRPRCDPDPARTRRRNLVGALAACRCTSAPTYMYIPDLGGSVHMPLFSITAARIGAGSWKDMQKNKSGISSSGSRDRKRWRIDHPNRVKVNCDKDSRDNKVQGLPPRVAVGETAILLTSPPHPY